MKNNISAILIIALCVSLCACRGKSGAVFYAPISEAVALPEELSGTSFVSADNERFYFQKTLNSGSVETGDFRIESMLLSVYGDGGELKALENYVLEYEGEETNTWVQVIALCSADEENLWVAERISIPIFELPEDFSGDDMEKLNYQTGMEQIFSVRKLDASGGELLKLDLPEMLDGEGVYVSSISSTAAGELVMEVGPGRAIAVGTDGKLKFKYSEKVNSGGIVRLLDGSVGMQISPIDGTGTYIARIDMENKMWEKAFEGTTSNYQLFSGGGEFEWLFNDNNGLVGYNSTSGKMQKLLNWADFDIGEIAVWSCSIAANGNISVLSMAYDSAGKMYYELRQFAPGGEEDAPNAGKKALVLAGVNVSSEIHEQVRLYNKESGDYRIEIKDYANTGTITEGEACTDAIKKLSTEMIAGDVPDILALGELPWEQYAAKGLLEDIYPFIDGDKELKREDFMANIIMAAETEGKLFQVVSRFIPVGFAGSKEIIGGENGWTMGELLTLIKEHPEADLPFGKYAQAESLFMVFFTANMDSYIDWQTAQCSFDNPEFISLLELAKLLMENEVEQNEELMNTEEYKLLDSGRQFCSTLELWSVSGAAYLSALYGDDFVFKGCPSPDKNSGVAVFENSLAMTSACENKEAVWQFLRGFMTREYGENNSTGLHINRASFDAKLQEAKTVQYVKDEKGEEVPMLRVSGPIGADKLYECYALTDEEAELVTRIVGGVEKSAYLNQSIMGIILDELNGYLSGGTTAEEAAALIQSRMSIYVSELS